MNKFCTNCGEKLNNGASFCKECGCKISNVENNNQASNSNTPPSSPNSSNQHMIPKASKSTSFSMKLVISILVLVILAFTNPDKAKHVEEANNVIKKVINKNGSKELFGNSTNDNQLLGGLALLFGDGLVDSLSEKLISRENYLIFSLTMFSYNGGETIVGFGILGNVIIFEKFEKDIDHELNKTSTPESSIDPFN